MHYRLLGSSDHKCFLLQCSPATSLVCTWTEDTSWQTVSQILLSDYIAFQPASWEAAASYQRVHEISWNNHWRVGMWKIPRPRESPTCKPTICFPVWICNPLHSPFVSIQLFNYRYNYISMYLSFMRSFKFAKIIRNQKN